jgi:adenylate cyclase
MFKKYILSFVIIILMRLTLVAQNTLIDSLTKVYNKSDDTTKIIVLSNISKLVSQNNPQRAETLGDSAIKLAKKIHFKRGLALAYQAIANAQTTTGKYDVAITNLLNSATICEKINDSQGLMLVSNNLGNAYLGLKKLDKAFDYYYKANELALQNNNQRYIATTSCGLASVLIQQKKYSKAIIYLQQAQLIFTKAKNTTLCAYATQMKGECQYRMGEYSIAQKNIESVVPVFKTINDEYALGLSYHNLGQIFYKQKNYNQAINNFTLALNYSIKRKAWDNIQENALILSQVHEKNDNLFSALNSYKVHVQYKDSIINKERNKSLADAETKFETQKKEQQIILKNAALETSQLKISKRNYLIYGFVAVFVLLSLLLFFLVKQIKLKKTANLLLTEKNEIINREKQRSDELLLNILPAEIAEELKQNGKAESKLHSEVSILFTDFKGFTQLSEQLTATQLIDELNYCFIEFDNIIHKHGIEKIKTIGDAYMAASGLPANDTQHAQKLVMAAIEIRNFMNEYKTERELNNKPYFTLRIGIHSGNVVAGIVGIKKFAYDVWGDTVNTASRMESSGVVGKINISQTTYELVKNNFDCEPRGFIEAKGKGQMNMYFVENKKA